MRKLPIVAGLVILAGCFVVAAGDVELEVPPIVVELGVDASGCVTQPVNAWTRDCTVFFEWKGALDGLGTLRDELERQLAAAGSSLAEADIAIETLELRFHDARLESGVEVVGLRLAIAIGDETVLDADGVERLEAAAELSPATIAKVQAALLERAPVGSSARLAVTFPAEKLPREKFPMRLTLPVRALASGTVTVR